jgi:thioredoxin
MIKKGIVLMAVPVLIGLASCGQTASGSDEGSAEVAAVADEVVAVADEVDAVADKKEVKKADHGTIMLSKTDFLTKVMNYEENPKEWKYLGEKPCLIDFYADWCAPCRTTSPILEELAKEYAGKINIYKIDTQKEQELAMVFGIQSIPAFLYCPMEGKPTMSSGIARTAEETKQMFRDQIDQLLLQ